MSNTYLTITPPSLPINYCFTDWQTFVNDSVGKALVNFDTTGLTGILSQNTTPTAVQRNFLWHNTDTSHVLFWNRPIGAWTSQHPVPTGGERRLYVGTTTDLQTYDGGNANAVGTASGPMWEVDTGFAGRMPIGVGNLPDIVNGTVAVAVNGTGGHNEIALVKANLPNVTVDVKTAVIGQSGVTGGGPNPVVGSTYGSDPITAQQAACDATSQLLSGTYFARAQTLPLGGGTAGDAATPVNNIGPFYGCYVIRRTGRLYWLT